MMKTTIKPTASHTPGPWRPYFNAVGGNRTYGIVAEGEDFKDEERQPYHPLVASVYRGHGHAPIEIAQANACLIDARARAAGERDESDNTPSVD
jgi:hypothetical protein